MTTKHRTDPAKSPPRRRSRLRSAPTPPGFHVAEKAPTRRDVDEALVESFPCSDPPSWTMPCGRS